MKRLEPKSEAELVEIIAAGGPFVVRGGGTRFIGRAQGTVISTLGLSGIRLYEPGALTVVVGAGTPLADVEKVLAKGKQRLAFEPTDMCGLLGRKGASTIGGVVASNTSGPRRVQVGAARDFLLGVRFVDGNGTLISNGGRVMKNVTGYDLAKLMAGSWGTVGVLSEVSLKVLPEVETQATISLSGLEDSQAITVLAAGLGSPFEVTGAAHDPSAGKTTLRIEGFKKSVAYRAGRLSEMLAPFGVVDVETAAKTVKSHWQNVRDVAPFHNVAGDVWRLSVKPSDAPGIVAGSGAKAALYDWGGGLVWLLMEEGVDLRAKLGDFAGHATLIRANNSRLSTFHPEPAAVAALTRGLREKFDPRGVLNAGLMG